MSARICKQVLVIDDDVDVLDAMRVVLRAEGYAVRVATGGFEALSMLADGPLPAVVITDVMMPDLSGWDVLECMRSDAALRRIPVIVTTASWVTAPPGDVEILEKPFDLDALLGLVAKYCDEPPDGHRPGQNRTLTDGSPNWAA